MSFDISMCEPAAALEWLMTDGSEPLFSAEESSHLAGLKPHTIQNWENRQSVAPREGRGKGSRRLRSARDLVAYNLAQRLQALGITAAQAYATASLILEQLHANVEDVRTGQPFDYALLANSVAIVRT